MSDPEITVVFWRDDCRDSRATWDDRKAFEELLKKQDIKYSGTTHFRMAADFPVLNEFTIMAKELGPAAITAIGGWFVGRLGRKARLRVGDIEVEAGSVKEVEKLLALARKQAVEHTNEAEGGSGPDK
ncbi:hypothetical protein [Paenirhodobacter sp.]|uniref:hypothetical protein n=1 Tax=Paenirhodobacter sp. TaxID=1965326 RepID=UPI003B40FE3E